MTNLNISEFNKLQFSTGSVIGILTTPMKFSSYDILVIVNSFSDGNRNFGIICRKTNGSVLIKGIPFDFNSGQKIYRENNFSVLQIGSKDYFSIQCEEIEIFDLGVIDWDAPENQNRRISEFEYLLYENPIDDNLE